MEVINRFLYSAKTQMKEVLGNCTTLDVVLLWSYSNSDLCKGQNAYVDLLFLSSFFFFPTLCLCNLGAWIEMIIFTLYFLF